MLLTYVGLEPEFWILETEIPFVMFTFVQVSTVTMNFVHIALGC